MLTFGAKVNRNIWGENRRLYIHVTYSPKTEKEKPPMFSLFYKGLISELEHACDVTQFNLKCILYAVKPISNALFTIHFFISRRVTTSPQISSILNIYLKKSLSIVQLCKILSLGLQMFKQNSQWL